MDQNSDPNYEVRYLLNGEESTDEVAANTAAEANEITKQAAVNATDDQYELIQVHKLEENEDEPQGESR